MRLLAFVPIKLTLLLIVGILIGNYFPFDSHYALFLTITFFVILSIIYQNEQRTDSPRFGILSYLTTITLGTFIILNAQPKAHSYHYSKLKQTENTVWHLKIREVLKPTSFSERYIAEVQYIDSSYATGKLILSRNTNDSLPLLQVDNELLSSLQPTSINPPLNSYQFNYKKYLARLGVYDELKLNSNTYLKKEKTSKTILGIAAKTRNHIIAKLKKNGFEKNELGVIQALLLVQRNDISKETYDDYKNAGAVHILALSGLHIGILLLVIQFLLRPLNKLPNGKKMSLLLTVLLLWCFALLAGLSASIVRACTMFSFVAYALYLNRPSNSFNILALSMFFILLFINPNLLFQVGFQMSYAAVLAIVWIYPLFQKFWYPKIKPVRYIWQLLSVSIAAQLGVLPISLFYFHQFPGLFFISNLLIVPALGCILGMGILVIILSLVNQLPEPVAWFYNQVIYYMNGVVAWVAKQEAFIFKHISFDAIQLVLAFCVIITIILTLTKISSKRIIIFLLSLLSFQYYTIFQEVTAGQQKETLLLHQTKNTLLLERNGKHATLFISDTTIAPNSLTDLKIEKRIQTIQLDTLANSYFVHEKSILILDSLGVYPKVKTESIYLLTNSPKINLDRLISITHPKEIIADGSNYHSYIKQWKATCLKRKIPFHYTGEKGFYTFK
jgi:competence protein ComEC